MKTLLIPLILLFFVFTSTEASAQLKNLDKRIGNKVNRKIDQKADRAIDKALDKGEKAIDEEVNDAVSGEKTEDNSDNDKIISESEGNPSPSEAQKKRKSHLLLIQNLILYPVKKSSFTMTFRQIIRVISLPGGIPMVRVKLWSRATGKNGLN